MLVAEDRVAAEGGLTCPGGVVVAVVVQLPPDQHHHRPSAVLQAEEEEEDLDRVGEDPAQDQGREEEEEERPQPLAVLPSEPPLVAVYLVLAPAPLRRMRKPSTRN